MGLIRSTISLAFLGLFILVGLTVPVGQRTLFGHVSNIWASDQAQELVEGVKDSSGPLVDRVKRGVEAGLSDEAPADSTTPVDPTGDLETQTTDTTADTTADTTTEGTTPVATKQDRVTGGDTSQ
jgi:hypothetical protein